MKKILIALLVCFSFVTANAKDYSKYYQNLPVQMQQPTLPSIPANYVSILEYGGNGDGLTMNTQAFAKAIEACHRAGGGRVVVPAGEWFTGPIHLKSHVNLFLEEGAVVRFSDNPNDYLPAVMTSWEGLECYNYSPLIYAFECENVGISGKGTLAPVMGTWRTWFKRPEAHLNALRQLYSMGSTDVPVEQRQMARG